MNFEFDDEMIELLNISCDIFLETDIEDISSETKDYNDKLLINTVFKVEKNTNALSLEEVRVLLISLMNYRFYLNDLIATNKNEQSLNSESNARLFKVNYMINEYEKFLEPFKNKIQS